MHIFLMPLGAAIAGGALFFWKWLNGMAASWSTGNSKPGIVWFPGEALLLFWLPVAVGLALALFGWFRK